MAWSKFDPHAPPAGDSAAPGALRRARVLKWGWWITTGMVVLGFCVMAYDLLRR